MQLKLLTYDLHLRHTFTISRESHDTQATLIVQLYSDGQFGLGETTSNPYYGNTVSGMVELIEQKMQYIELHSFSTPTSFYELLQQLFPTNSFIRCAFDMAAMANYKASRCTNSGDMS